MSGVQVRVTATPTPAAPPDTRADLVWRQPFDIANGQSLWLAANRSAWLEIGEQSLIAVGVEDPDEESVRGTYLEIISQAWSSVGRDIGDRLDRQVLPVGGSIADSWPATETNVEIQVQFPGRSPVSLCAALPAAFLGELQPKSSPVASTTPFPTSADTPAPAPASHPSRTLDLLLDVEMPVSVSFGRLMVPLKDVLKLTSGSVIELNRTVSEPVEIIVNNCVIARGDVVVIEGNYGVRIQNIVNSHERLRTLS